MSCQASSLGAYRLNLLIAIYSCCVPVMDSDRHKDSGETNKGNTCHWMAPQDLLCKGCPMHWQMLGKGSMSPPVEEYAMMLEVMMADRPGQLHPPMFSWNVGMVMHVLKSNPVLRELEHMQVDGPGTAYLFFYDKQGHRGLGQDTTCVIRAHMEEAFSEWISHSAHFTISLLPLVEAWQ